MNENNDKSNNDNRTKRRWPGIALLIGLGIIVYLFYIQSTIGIRQWTGFQDKTFWDVLDLAIIPLVLAIGGYLFSRTKRETNREIAASHALQLYYDRITELILREGLGDLQKDDSKARTIARARTLTTLHALSDDPVRKTSIARFLLEAGLIAAAAGGENSKVEPNPPVINLHGAELQGVDLTDANLRGADLHLADLSRANLRRADLSKANLGGADLQRADLSKANLQKINLSKANLRQANLHIADLSGADLQAANLGEADLHLADLQAANLQEANLQGANLRLADLQAANLQEANLQAANLVGANLRQANLRQANLIGADLREADLQGIDLQAADLRKAIASNEQLSQARSLRDATMPDGTKHD